MTTTRNARSHTDDHDDRGFQAQASRFSRKLGESAEQVWLAGLGAFGRAQSEGSRLFESLVKEGATYQREGKRRAESGADAMRDQVEAGLGQARESWHRLGKAFDERVKGVLHALQVPDRAEVENLRAEVESLKAQLHAAQVRARRAGRSSRARSTPADHRTPPQAPPSPGE
ncbi:MULTISPECIES: phasin family protein [Gammaproteobacteria]|jgi:poly(hydroxyalkanoate) granule-associated protein|uniref:Poly(Hydroxyalcanoate) granule associated protein n=1 Tax=Xanthomonas boreopolis TaxID=86183 RepID=A0A919F846_9XANT|nr:phasin family protein [Pseudomonas sp. Hp2]GHH54410.1 poly(hydroxyalcanoate) granule associated protein [[Pseudomonas] boreopolis]